MCGPSLQHHWISTCSLLTLLHVILYLVVSVDSALLVACVPERVACALDCVLMLGCSLPVGILQRLG